VNNVKCRNCARLNGGRCLHYNDFYPDIYKKRECQHFQQITNADRIRRMTDLELETLLEEHWDGEKYAIWCDGHKCGPNYNCDKCIAEWLGSPCENPNG
jgi:hypothetical protein